MWKIAAAYLMADGALFAADHQLGAIAFMVGILPLFIVTMFQTSS